MKYYDIVIVGGSAAGLAVLKSCSRLYPEKSKLLIKKDEKTMIPCAIPYVYGEIGAADKNLIPNAMIEKCGAEALFEEVVSIDRKNKIVKLGNGEEVQYDKLVLGIGSSPVVPAIEGVGKKNVCFVKKEAGVIDDLKDKIANARNVVIVGGGYIGVEFAEQIKEVSHDKNVTIVEGNSRCLAGTFDEEFSSEIEAKLRYVGINILTGKSVEEFVGDEFVSGAKLNDGSFVDCDLVIIGVGAKANVDVAKSCGLEIAKNGSIQVNRFMKTNDLNVFACGDCSSKFSFFTHKLIDVKLASYATVEGRIIAENLYENNFAASGVIGVYSTKVHDKVYSGAGLIKYIAVKEGISVIEGSADVPDRHPGSLDDASKIHMKLLFNKKNKVLIGAQVSGPKAVGEIINQLSIAIEHKLTAYDLYFMQPGTQPKVSPSPLVYETIVAAEDALKKLG